MSSNFPTGLKVIWPLDGVAPPKHEHDVIFVHGFHRDYISDWKDQDGVCWPAEHLSLDLGNARILVFGYDPAHLGIEPDGHFQGCLILKQAMKLCEHLKDIRSQDKVSVPITLIGHGTGGILIKSALCVPHTRDGRFGFILNKTKHVMFFDTPQASLSWETWQELSRSSSSENSIGRWKVWSAALDGSQKAFKDIAHRFNITSVWGGLNEHAGSNAPDLDSDTLKATHLAHESRQIFEGVDHQTISQLDRRSHYYGWTLKRIQDGRFCTTRDPDEIQKIRDWIGRRVDVINKIDHQTNIDRQHMGTGRWLFEDRVFREWVNPETETSILWLTGPEGCGKSVLCSLAIERLKHNVKRYATAYLMLTFDNLRSGYQILAQLALQLLDYVVENCGGIDTEALLGLHEEREDNKKLVKTQKLIQTLVSQCPAVLIFIDGLDKIAEDQLSVKQSDTRAELRDIGKDFHSHALSFLAGLAGTSHGTPLRLWCSSLKTRRVTKWMEGLGAVELQADEKAITRDVTHFLDYEISRAIRRREYTPSQPDENIYVPVAAGCNILLASLEVGRLQKSILDTRNLGFSPNSRGVNTAREHFQEALDNLMGREKSLDNDQTLAVRILSLLAYAKRPLRLEEVGEALAIIERPLRNVQSATFYCEDLSPANSTQLDGYELQDRFMPFLKFMPLEKGMKTGYLRLSHASVLEFLSASSASVISVSQGLLISPNIISDACLRYLSQNQYSFSTRNHESFPGARNMTGPIQGHHFLPYAAKYWHKHINESDPFPMDIAGAFLHSSQFISAIRSQSLLLDRQFNLYQDNASMKAKPASEKAPAKFELRENLQVIAGDYQKFVQEWSNFLKLGVTDAELHGAIEHCFWGALGPGNFLSEHGSVIERNQSFLLEMEIPIEDEKNQNAPLSYFQEAVSADGSCVSVWKMPVQSDEDWVPTLGPMKLTREAWIVDGETPPRRYGLQENLTFDPCQVLWDSYDSFRSRRFSFMPIIDSSARVPPIDERVCGTSARVGNSLFLRQHGGNWAVSAHEDGTTSSLYWEDITTQGVWVVKSRRKDIDLGIRRYTTPDDSTKEVETQSQPDKAASSGSDSSLLSDSDNENAELFSELRDLASSAEEFCVDSNTDMSSDDSNEDNLWILGDADGDTESTSSSESESTSDESTTSRNEAVHTNNAPDRNSNDGQVESSEDSDADDEGSNFNSESDSDSQSGSDSSTSSRVNLANRFSGHHTCDICDADIESTWQNNVRLQKISFYQCMICSSNCFDVCSLCFERGAWCNNIKHSLSKGTLRCYDRRVFWQGGISPDKNPCISIIAGHEEEDQNQTGGCLLNISFRYVRRHSSMLHSSPPIIHPSHPLLVYALDGREFLFANLKRNTYLKHEVPFGAPETAHTSASTCIPISVHMSFSPCANYVRIARFTARRESPMFGPMRLSVGVFVIELSSHDACSGKPRTLPGNWWIDLGVWPTLVPHLPYSVTWSHSDAYIALSGDTLRVFRIGFPATDSTDFVASDGAVWALSSTIPLPSSSRSRAIYFFPAEERASAKIILGSMGGDTPEPPIVVYLQLDSVGCWTKLEQSKANLSARQPITRKDPFIEFPSAEDDWDQSTTKSTDTKHVYHFLCKSIQDQLENELRRRRIFCPSCIHLSRNLFILSLPNSSPIFPYGIEVPEEFDIPWNVKPATFIKALRDGCQFCCYIASRLLTFDHTSVIGQVLGADGPRCCARGSETGDLKDIEKAISNLQKMAWKVRPEDRSISFACRVFNRNPINRSLNKIVISLPSILTGNADPDANFGPTMVMFQSNTDTGETRTMTSFLYSSGSSQGPMECVLELYTLPDDAAHDWIPTRPLSTYRGGDKNLEVSKAWLEDCLSSHTICQRKNATENQLPSRLIRIVGGRATQLVETEGQFGQYVALSYCWGPNPDENCKTTISNQQERLQLGGLLQEDLPAVIQDAVIVTGRLGIGFIWVDALCITQDDPEDKNKELGRMSQYYKNSYLTIAASTPRCTTGFIGTIGRCEKHPKSSLPRDLVPLNIFWALPTGDGFRTGKAYVRQENPYRFLEEPINKRAWTLQESLLAPRVLFFGSRVMWACRHMTHSDGGVEDWSADDVDLHQTRRTFQIELDKLDRDDRDSTSPSQLHHVESNSVGIYNVWHQIVASYSRRDISRSEDKLPAISAVATEFSRLTNDDYAAGLWRANLARDLLWSTKDAVTKPAKPWRAPSWSWASIDDTITYDTLPPADCTLVAHIDRVESTPRFDAAPFGEVSRGVLQITAPCLVLDDLGLRDEFTKALLSKFGIKTPKSERGMLFDALRSFQGGGASEEKTKFQLPEQAIAMVLYGQKDELFDRTDDSADSEDKVERWITWGLILKPVKDDSNEVLFERVVAFTQMPGQFHGFEAVGGFFSGARQTIQVI